jgi:hypothetical protein
MSEPIPTPNQIVQPDGTVNEGWFQEPFVEANLQEAPILRPLPGVRGPLRRILQRGLRKLRLKQWHYTSVATDESFLAAAIFNAGYIGLGFVYVVDRKSGAVHEYGTMTPLSRGVRIAPNSLDGISSISGRGFGQITCENSSATGVRVLRIDLQAQKGHPPLCAEFTLFDNGKNPEPMVVVDKLAPRRWLYTHKCYGLEAKGFIKRGQHTETVKRGGALAGIDWNRGFRLYETFWNWAAATGRDQQGRPVGFTMTARKPKLGTEPTAAFSTTDGDATDCALWLEGRRVKLRRVRFDYDSSQLMSPWRISDVDGLVDLRFQPAGQRVDDTNFGVVISQFHQPYGVFSGTLRSPEGEIYTLEDVYGVTEEHYARW